MSKTFEKVLYFKIDSLVKSQFYEYIKINTL
jgi:hypothetical protein